MVSSTASCIGAAISRGYEKSWMQGAVDVRSSNDIVHGTQCNESQNVVASTKHTVVSAEHRSKGCVGAWRRNLHTKPVRISSLCLTLLPSVRSLFLISSAKRENSLVNDYINK